MSLKKVGLLLWNLMLLPVQGAEGISMETKDHDTSTLEVKLQEGFTTDPNQQFLEAVVLIQLKAIYDFKEAVGHALATSILAQAPETLQRKFYLFTPSAKKEVRDIKRSTPRPIKLDAKRLLILVSTFSQEIDLEKSCEQTFEKLAKNKSSFQALIDILPDEFSKEIESVVEKSRLENIDLQQPTKNLIEEAISILEIARGNGDSPLHNVIRKLSSKLQTVFNESITTEDSIRFIEELRSSNPKLAHKMEDAAFEMHLREIETLTFSPETWERDVNFIKKLIENTTVYGHLRKLLEVASQKLEPLEKTISSTDISREEIAQKFTLWPGQWILGGIANWLFLPDSFVLRPQYAELDLEKIVPNQLRLAYAASYGDLWSLYWLKRSAYYLNTLADSFEIGERSEVPYKISKWINDIENRLNIGVKSIEKPTEYLNFYLAGAFLHQQTSSARTALPYHQKAVTYKVFEKRAKAALSKLDKTRKSECKSLNELARFEEETLIYHLGDRAIKKQKEAAINGLLNEGRFKVAHDDQTAFYKGKLFYELGARYKFKRDYELALNQFKRGAGLYYPCAFGAYQVLKRQKIPSHDASARKRIKQTQRSYAYKLLRRGMPLAVTLADFGSDEVSRYLPFYRTSAGGSPYTLNETCFNDYITDLITITQSSPAGSERK